ncbi:MAG TPA: aspartyl protease family protein, partial [Thermoanaerobaculia bacterium]|nr:aspartyl protease family protein [Thermoanaerobaculia bacterium]
EAGEFQRAVALSSFVDGRRASAAELAALGKAEVAAARYSAARKHLHAALALQPPRSAAAAIHWDLSQAEYLTQNFDDAVRHAEEAVRLGLSISPWHLALMRALAPIEGILENNGQPSGWVPMKFGDPDIPRVEVILNGVGRREGVIDSGAVFTILGETVAAESGVRFLGDFRGTLIGLLGEPIPVRFGILDSLSVGDFTVSNVPVAVIADHQLQFFVMQRTPFEIEILLGTNLLKDLRVDLDFPERRLAFEPKDPASEPRGDQNLFFVELQPMIHVSINRKGWFLFLLDTGSEITFLNQERLRETSVRNWTQLHGAALQGLGGSRKVGEKLRDVELAVAGWAGAFGELPLYGSRSQAFGILGENFLQQFRVVIDFGKMRLDFIKASPV